MRFRLLKCLAKAISHKGVQFVCNLVPGGSAAYDLYEIAAAAWEDYSRDLREDSLRAEVEALASSSPSQLGAEVQAAIAATGPQPPEVQQAMGAYLAQVPGMVRRSLRRPSDPSGCTSPPGFKIAGASDLLQFLPPRPPRFKPGDRPPGVGDWVLEELLGVGGFGEVWKARHAHLQSKAPVALKFCLDDRAVPALRNEAGVLDQVMRHGKHPGIVPLLQTYLSASPPCLEYEFVEGSDLGALTREWHARGQMSADKATLVLVHLADIVAHAHSANPPIVHDDLKPANVLVKIRDGNKVSLRVTDFGIGGLATAPEVRESRQTRGQGQLLTETVRGAYTPLYACPEQMLRVRGQPADPRDDIHALGVIWLQLVTGDLAMMSLPTDWREQVEQCGLKPDLVKLLGSCIAPRAEKRPPNARILSEKIRAALGLPEKPPETTQPSSQGAAKGTPQPAAQKTAQPAAPPTRTATTPPAPPATTQPAPPQPARRSLVSRRAVLGLSVGAVILAGGGVVWWRRRNPYPDFNPRPGGKAGELVTNPLGMKFAWCPPGSFQMGSPEGEKGHQGDEKLHKVTLTNGFFLGIYPVTQKQWTTVMGSNPSSFKGEERPVENVSWVACQSFCSKLAWMTGKSYRLPTEAEWEYACRAGTSTEFWSGIGEEALQGAGWYSGNSNGETHFVGQKAANGWWLYDMHGNVYEWCEDRYGDYQGDGTNPQGSSTGEARVVRGGSCVEVPERCRAAFRRRNPPTSTRKDCGFRVVLALD